MLTYGLIAGPLLLAAIFLLQTRRRAPALLDQPSPMRAALERRMREGRPEG